MTFSQKEKFCMQDNKEILYQEWFKKAEEDELSIRALLEEGGGAPSTICFLAQQMSEKYLKGLLVFRVQIFRKIHDLLDLETLLQSVDPDIIDIHAELTLLNRYYIETRYPGDYPEFSQKEAEEAFAAASRIKEFALKKTNSKKERKTTTKSFDLSSR